MVKKAERGRDARSRPLMVLALRSSSERMPLPRLPPPPPTITIERLTPDQVDQLP